MKTKSVFHPLGELVYLSIIATLTLFCGAVYLQCKIDLILILTFPFIVFGIYTINRYTDVEDILNDPDKRNYFDKNYLWLFISIFLFSLSIFVLLVTRKLTVYHLLLILAGVTYSVRIIPWVSKSGNAAFKRLKDIPFAKSSVVSIFLGSSFFLIYWQLYPDFIQNRTQVLLITFSFILGIFINTNFADLRDYIGDKAAGIPTIPVIIGKRNTYIFAMIIPGSLWLLVSGYLFYTYVISLEIFFFFILNLLYPVFYISLYHISKFPKKLVEPIADACVLVYALGLVVLRFTS